MVCFVCGRNFTTPPSWKASPSNLHLPLEPRVLLPTLFLYPSEQSCTILAILSVPQDGHRKRKTIITIAQYPSHDYRSSKLFKQYFLSLLHPSPDTTFPKRTDSVSPFSSTQVSSIIYIFNAIVSTYSTRWVENSTTFPAFLKRRPAKSGQRSSPSFRQGSY